MRGFPFFGTHHLPQDASEVRSTCPHTRAGAFVALALNGAWLAILPNVDALETPGSFCLLKEMTQAHDFRRAPVSGQRSQGDMNHLRIIRRIAQNVGRASGAGVDPHVLHAARGEGNGALEGSIVDGAGGDRGRRRP